MPRQYDLFHLRCRCIAKMDNFPPGWHYHLDEVLWSCHSGAPKNYYYYSLGTHRGALLVVWVS